MEATAQNQINPPIHQSSACSRKIPARPRNPHRTNACPVKRVKKTNTHPRREPHTHTHTHTHAHTCPSNTPDVRLRSPRTSQKKPGSLSRRVWRERPSAVFWLNHAIPCRVSDQGENSKSNYSSPPTHASQFSVHLRGKQQGLGRSTNNLGVLQRRSKEYPSERAHDPPDRTKTNPTERTRAPTRRRLTCKKNLRATTPAADPRDTQPRQHPKHKTTQLHTFITTQRDRGKTHTSAPGRESLKPSYIERTTSSLYYEKHQHSHHGQAFPLGAEDNSLNLWPRRPHTITNNVSPAGKRNKTRPDKQQTDSTNTDRRGKREVKTQHI